MAHKLTAEQADELLDKLASDDKFREQLLGNPALTLHTMGIDVDRSQVPTVRKLPPKEAVAANRDALRSQLTDRVGLVIFLVE
ncbi:MAG TPA: NHLP-related RiPP peptide [Xanthomonadaceae bacterium]|nr:NHLP-related RiPP peptide [Xanthomonadaceae bacterium]